MCFGHPAEYASTFVRECQVFISHCVSRLETLVEKMRQKNPLNFVISPMHFSASFQLDTCIIVKTLSIFTLVFFLVFFFITIACKKIVKTVCTHPVKVILIYNHPRSMIYILKVTIQFSHSPFPVNDEQGYFESCKMSHCP